MFSGEISSLRSKTYQSLHFLTLIIKAMLTRSTIILLEPAKPIKNQLATNHKLFLPYTAAAVGMRSCKWDIKTRF